MKKIAEMFLREIERGTDSCCSELDRLKVESPWSGDYPSWVEAHDSSDQKENVNVYFSKIRRKVREYRLLNLKQNHLD